MRQQKKPFVERREVIALRRLYPTVHRVRVSDKSTTVKRDPHTGEELWKVGSRVMTESQMVALAEKETGQKF